MRAVALFKKRTGGGETMESPVPTLAMHFIYDGGVSHYIRLNLVRLRLGRALSTSSIGANNKVTKPFLESHVSVVYARLSCRM